MKKVALIEVNSWHEEIILPQVLFLQKANYKVTLYINDKLRDAKILNELEGVSIVYIHGKKKKITLLQSYLIALRLVFKKPDTIVFNTFENFNFQKFICFLLPSVKQIGIIHNLGILKQPNLTLTHFLFLSRNVYQYAEKKFPQYSYSYFYPILKIDDAKKNFIDNEIKIVIPGLIDLNRRDYLGLIDMVKKRVPVNIKFVLLGNSLKYDGPKVRETITQLGLHDSFTLYDGFIPYDVFFNVVNESHLIMPLIQPSCKFFEDYHHSKITGGFNMAFSSRTPMYLFDSFKEIDEFKECSIFYNYDNFNDMLENLNMEMLKIISQKIDSNPSFNFEKQAKSYIEFLNQPKS